MRQKDLYTLGIDIGSTTVKIAVLNDHNEILFSDYERHYANIQETLSDLLGRALYTVGSVKVSPMITGSGGLTLAKHLGVPFVQEVIAVFLPCRITRLRQMLPLNLAVKTPRLFILREKMSSNV